MEYFKTFTDCANEKGGSIEDFDTSFIPDFEEYMRESVRISNQNNMLAEISASKAIINH